MMRILALILILNTQTADKQDQKFGLTQHQSHATCLLGTLKESEHVNVIYMTLKGNNAICVATTQI